MLGAGKMGGILLQGFLKNNLLGSDQIAATVQHEDRATALSAQFGVSVTTDNLAAATWADVILLGVKPVQVPGLLWEDQGGADGEEDADLVCGFGDDWVD